MTSAAPQPSVVADPQDRQRSVQRFGWSLLIEVPHLFAGLVTFSTLVFLLEPSLYGQIGTMVAVAAIIGPIATFGSSWRMLQKVVASDDPKGDLGSAVSVSLVGTFAAAIVLSVATPFVFGDVLGRLTLLVFLLAQVSGLLLIELLVTYTVGIGRLPVGAAIRLIGTGARIIAVVVFASGANHSVEAWVWHLGASTLLSVVASLGFLSVKTEGRLSLSLPHAGEFWAGVPYSLGSTTESFLAASDRPLLQRAGFSAATGTYSAGYRIVTLAFIPLMALLKAQDRLLFSAGAEGIKPAYEAGKKIAKMASIMMAFVSLLMLLAAVILELLLVSFRPEYQDSARVVRWLALLPLIKAVQFSFGNVLTAAKEQQSRLRLTAAATGLNFVGNILLIPAGSWRAAVATTLVAEVFLAALLWRTCQRLASK